MNRADSAAIPGVTGETGGMRATEGDGVEQILKAEIQSSAKLEKPSLRRVAAPAGVRWREFRIQVLPLVAFGGSMLLAAVLWHRAVMPVPVESEGDPPPADLSQSQDPGSSVPSPAIHQASRSSTNGLFKAPDSRFSRE